MEAGDPVAPQPARPPVRGVKRAIPGITQHMLTAQLRELEADGLVSRKIFPEVPPRLEYAITPRAKALKPVIDAIFGWWSMRRGAIGS